MLVNAAIGGSHWVQLELRIRSLYMMKSCSRRPNKPCFTGANSRCRLTGQRFHLLCCAVHQCMLRDYLLAITSSICCRSVLTVASLHHRWYMDLSGTVRVLLPAALPGFGVLQVSWRPCHVMHFSAYMLPSHLSSRCCAYGIDDMVCGRSECCV